MECHKTEYDRWQNSHHDRAMDVASDETVLGDFNKAVVEFHGVASRFYRKDKRFFVHTQGRDGKMAEFDITHTFGRYTLQKYLAPFPGGRLQCLPIAWDAREKKRYHLYVELCAPCHARRAILGDYTHAEADLLDSLLPSLLPPELYFSDGQILEEVYVYGSFTQSKMYRRNVRCSDCHDVHSIKKVKEGNEPCLQCHRAAVYDSRAHHFHKYQGEKGEPIKSADGNVLFDVGTGADCVQCHMPERPYMGIDYRADHSFRIPRPDLSIKLGVPNACNRCHYDKPDQWSDDYITQWYGPGCRAHYGTIIAQGRKRSAQTHKDLVKLASDLLHPVIVRSTALSLPAAYPGEATSRAYALALMGDEALIRWTAMGNLHISDPKRQTELLAAMLYDPVKAVRMEAARRISEIGDLRLDDAQTKALQAALTDYRKSMEYSADFAFGRYNLGNLYAALQPDNLDYLYALAGFYLKRKKLQRARSIAKEMVARHPNQRIGHDTF